MTMEIIVPLTELVHYFNKRNRLARGATGEDEFGIVDGRVQARFRGRVLGTLFQPVVERSGLVLDHEAYLRVLEGEGLGLPPMRFFSTLATTKSWFILTGWRARCMRSIFCWSGSSRVDGCPSTFIRS